MGEAAENENLGELTIIAVYMTDLSSLANRSFGFGTSSSGGRGGQNRGNLHLANDPSIQQDDGQISVTQYNQGVPDNFFIRSTVMSSTNGATLAEFFNGTEVMNTSAAFLVRSDNFYLGDVRYAGGFSNDIAEVLVYDSALNPTDRTAVES